MLILWGTRQQQHKLGFVAEFCPVCRKITPFHVSAIRTVSHLYGVAVGSAQALGHTGNCEACGTRIALNAADYRGFSREAGSDVEALIQQTFPEIRARRGQRLELAECLRTGTLYPAERALLLAEAFEIFAHLTEANFSDATQIRGRGAWCGLGTIVLCVGLGWAASNLTDSTHQDYAMLAVFTIAVFGGLASLILLATEPRRSFARKILPNFAAMLRPLRPSREEIADLLARLKQARLKLGKRLKPERLWKALEALPVPEPVEETGRPRDRDPLPVSSAPPPIPLDSATLAAGERTARIIETFQTFAERTQANYGGGLHVRGRGGWGCLGTILLCIAVGWAGAHLASGHDQEDHVFQIVATIAVAGGIYSLVQLFLEQGRIFHRKICPELVAALRPFELSREEIHDILGRFRAAGFKLGTKLQPEWLCAALDAQSAPVGPPPMPQSGMPAASYQDDGLF